MDDANSPARLEVDSLISRSGLRDLQGEFREAHGSIQIEGTAGVNPGTVGTAVDLVLRFRIEPNPDMRLATVGAYDLGRGAGIAAKEIVDGFTGSQATSTAKAQDEVGDRSVPADLKELVRACWVLAWFVERFRSGGPVAEALAFHLRANKTPDGESLLALVPQAAVTETAAIVALAERSLIPFLPGQPASWHVGPTFTASLWMPADADLIAERTLVEIKTNLGTKNTRGIRVPSLTAVTVRQVLGYILHDVDNYFKLEELAIYSARYGTVVRWPVQGLLDRLAGKPIDLSSARARYQQMLQSGKRG